MKAILILIIVSISVSLKAQTWDEIFKQKETQKKYLFQQLTALKLYAGYLKQGYDIVNKGANTIKSFTKGEFDLHKVFFNSLNLINPEIADKGKIADVLAWQIAIKRNFGSLSSKNNLSPGDRTYFEDVQSKVLKECGYDLDELILVISSGKLEMKDDERLNRLELIYRRMKDKYQFSQTFIAQVNSLNVLRNQEAKNLEASKKLYRKPN